VHVGANTGQEAQLYAENNLNVLWIEPIPHVYKELVQNIAVYPAQRAHNALVTDTSGIAFNLNIADNGGQSSSIFDLAEHKEIWPEVKYEGTINLTSETVDDILSELQFAADGLVMDVQGAELLVLKGCKDHIQQFKYIKAEASDFNSYDGGTTVDEIELYLKEYRFMLVRKDRFAEKPNKDGSYFDILFERK
jgi:FkbM family methyltransferase